MSPPTPAAVRPRRLEQDIQREVLKLLHARGVAAWPMNRESGVRRALGNERIAARIGGPGFADIVGLWCGGLVFPAHVSESIYGGSIRWRDGKRQAVVSRGALLAIEAKAPKARTAKLRALAQAAFGATVTQAGGIYLRIDPNAEASACVQVCNAFGWKIEGTER